MLKLKNILPFIYVFAVIVAVASCEKDDDPTPSNQTPTASFSVSNENPGTGESVTFTDLSSDPDGSISSWNWDFGNGDTSTDQNPTYTYDTEGTYEVKLTVTDNYGETASSTRSIMVSNSNPAPVADFTFEVNGENLSYPIILADSLISFVDASADANGSIVSWQWELGDGNTESTQSVTDYSYSNGATSYEVTLTVTDDEGATGSVTKKVYVAGIKWTFPVNAMETGCPAIDANGDIYLGDRGGFVYKIDHNTGNQIWMFEAGERVRNSITLSEDEGTVYVGSNADKYFALNASSGAVIWSVDVDGNIDKSSTAIDASGNLYVGTSSGTLYSFDPSGNERWTFNGGHTDGSIQSSPLVADGQVFVAIDSVVYSVNPADGSQNWFFALDADRYEGHFAYNNGTLYFGAEENDDNFGRLFAVNAMNGSLIWQKMLPGEVRANSPIIGPDGTLYVTTEDGGSAAEMAMYAFNANNGSQVWKSEFFGDDLKVAATLGSSGILYVGSNDDSFYLVNSADGSLITKFSYEAADHSIPPAIGSDGTVYFGNRGSLFYAMKILDDGEESLPTSGWPIVGGNARHTDRAN